MVVGFWVLGFWVYVLHDEHEEHVMNWAKRGCFYPFLRDFLGLNVFVLREFERVERIFGLEISENERGGGNGQKS